MSDQYIIDRLLVLTHAGGVDKAIPWLMAAADKSHPDALYLLGHIYESGLDGGNPSLKKAKEHYKMAASLGYAPARWKLSHLDQRKKKDRQIDDIDNGKFVPEIFKKAKSGPINVFYDNEKSEATEDVAEPVKEEKKDETPPAVFTKAKKELSKVEIPNKYKPYKGEEKSEKRTRKSLYEDSYDPMSSAERFTFHPLDETVSSQERLNTLTGMQKVKDQLALIQKRMEFDLLRKDYGFQTKPASNHFVFKGNPGTGKTEIARIMGKFFHEQKVVTKGHVVEVERADIVGGYIGKTAHYTRQAIEEAVGGILFVDEAHSLYVKGGYWDYGGEAISTILKGMEDHRDDLIVIMAGYSDEMDALLKSNPGLKSRIRHQIDFPDYTPEELIGIFEKFCREENYVLHPDACVRLHKLLERAVTMLDKQFGNGRFVRNIYEASIENMARRVVQGGHKEKHDLQNILFTDIPALDNLPGIDKKKLKTIGENIFDLRDKD